MVEYLKIIFRDIDHPNLPFYHETMFKKIFDGDLSKKDEPQVIDSDMLISNLEKGKVLFNFYTIYYYE